MKTCKDCGVNKPLTEFHPAKGYALGVKPRCKPCHSVLTAGYKQKETKEQRRRYWVKHRYGLTFQEYGLLLVRAANCCEVCGVATNEPHVDHDHVTGKVRGLLCDSCNRGIGAFKDNPEFLENAANYLQRF